MLITRHPSPVVLVLVFTYSIASLYGRDLHTCMYVWEIFFEAQPVPAYVAGGRLWNRSVLVSAAFEPRLVRLTSILLSDSPPLDIMILLSSYGCISLLS